MAEKESPNDHLARHDRELSNIRNQFLQPVTEHRAGIMTGQDRRDLTHALGMRDWIYEKTSVFDLPEGHYETTWNLLTDTPIPKNESIVDGAPYCEVDIELATVGDNRYRRQIKFYESITGRVWRYSIHESGSGINNVPKLWRESLSEARLWKGSVQDVGSKITLLDSLANYTYMLVGYVALSGTSYVRRGTDGNITIRDFNQASDDARWFAHYETVLQSDANNTLTIKQATGVLRNADGSTTSDVNKIAITEIRGVR